MEKQMQKQMETQGPFKTDFRHMQGFSRIMENQMEKNMQNDMETGSM